MKKYRVEVKVHTDAGVVFGEYSQEFMLPSMATTFLGEVMTVVKLTATNPSGPVNYHVRVYDVSE